MTRNLRCLVFVGTIGVSLAVAGPAGACSALDLGCSAGSSVDAIGDVVDDADEVVDDTIGPVEDPVGGLVDDATGAIEDVLRGAPNVPGVDPPGTPSPPGTTPPSDPGDGHRGDEPRLDRPRERWTSAPSRGRAAPAFTGPESVTQAPTPSTDTASTAGRAPARAPVGIGDVFAAAVPSMIALVALFGLVLAFVAAQGWVDRRDPRLAVARSADEVVRFR